MNSDWHRESEKDDGRPKFLPVLEKMEKIRTNFIGKTFIEK